MSKSKNKRRRLPNGFGQISEIKGQNLRKPFRAMVTVGKNENGRPICKTLKPEAYFSTYNEAYEALMEYHKDPFLKMSDMTMVELYNKWSEWYFKRITSKSTRNIESAWAYASAVHKMRVTELRPKHIRACIESGTREINGVVTKATPNVKKRMKQLFNMMLDYAVEYDIVEHNCAREMKLPMFEKVENEDSHIPFTNEEMNIFWNNTDIPFVKIILIHCYSGWRPFEMCSLTVNDTYLEDGYFRGGVKTNAGKDRVVPIHPRVQPFVNEFYDLAVNIGSDSLFNLKKSNSKTGIYSNIPTYSSYRYNFNQVTKKLGINPQHRPHDCRKHFVTMAKEYNVDEYAIKYIVGHRIPDLTERVYTHREISWLKEEMEKIEKAM